MRVLLLALVLLLAGVPATGAVPVFEPAAPPCGGPQRLAATVVAIFTHAADHGDANLDGRVSAADLVADASLGAPPLCPSRPARVSVVVENRSGERVVDVTLRGRRVQCLCSDGGLSVFEASFRCVGSAATPCGEIGGLAPGEWLFAFSVDRPATGQVQYRRAVVVSDASPQRSMWTAFAAVSVVDDVGDQGEGTLRARVAAASAQPAPLLIRFDDAVFPPGAETAIVLDTPMPPLAASDVTIDAIDALGLRGMRVLDADGRPFGALSITGARNHLIGLGLRNAGGQDRDVLRVVGPAAEANVLEDLVVAYSATGDGIGVDAGAGRAFDASATVIRGCEVRGAGDKGIKVTTGSFARVERSWIHGNAAGGVQATLGGNVFAVDNLVEANRGLGPQNGFAVQGLDVPGGLSTMLLLGNLSRNNGGNGLSVRSFSSAWGADNVFAGNATGGVRVFNDIGAGALLVLEGSAAVCNADDGVSVRDTSLADLGGGPFGSRGANAFAWNGSDATAVNLRSTIGDVVMARGAQWEHCGAAESCDEASILMHDVRAVRAVPDVSLAVAPQALGAPEVSHAEPEIGRAGAWLRIFGSGFDAVGRLPSGGSECAPTPAVRVLVGDREAVVEAVTPTMILARWPATCLEPVPLVVIGERLVGEVASAPILVCSHPPAHGAGGAP